ncbi:hypothetical protein [Rhodococcoides fascians]|uniref:hypothetical protein n=1 Tax=Rhodococcoides fascians TaxID=1828 RepID=UPI00056D2D0F|nr:MULTISPECIES: hypothetical protein [Rhodococcus]OZF05566.1 hypothetical protein CH301_04035 [Rhodococcus sp. 15-1189-1-1a]OZF20350.1 hypothetical protein CH299_04580 [Rhodococcus sp. 14-2686-1-2]
MAFTKGQNLSILVDAEQWNAHAKDIRVEPDDGEENEFLTFAAYSEGDTDKWFLRGTAFQDFAPDSFWTWAWLNSGQTVPYIVAPYGNPVASEAQPHYAGEVRISRKPGLGGEVNEPFEWEFEWECTGTPERKIAA